MSNARAEVAAAGWSPDTTKGEQMLQRNAGAPCNGDRWAGARELGRRLTRPSTVAFLLLASFALPVALTARAQDDKAILLEGNVGIGIDKPQSKLDVSGDARVSGAVNAGTLSVSKDAKVEGNLSARSLTGLGAIPVGMIAMWSGEPKKVPAGWVLCDGQKTKSGIVAPDLRGRFVVGYTVDNVAYSPSSPNDYRSIGNSGGQEKVTLTVDQMPSHSHQGETEEVKTELGLRRTSGVGESHWGLAATGTDRGAYNLNKPHKHKLSIANAGGGKPHENRPPYYVLAFIMYVGQ